MLRESDTAVADLYEHMEEVQANAKEGDGAGAWTSLHMSVAEKRAWLASLFDEGCSWMVYF